MKQFEYKTEFLGNREDGVPTEEFVRLANNQGQDGWEMVHVSSDLLVIYKREINQDPEPEFLPEVEALRPGYLERIAERSEQSAAEKAQRR